MSKITGSNVRLYMDTGDGESLVAYASETSFNFDTDIEEVTSNKSGKWAENAPTLNRWSADTTVWYHNSVGTSEVNFSDIMDAWLSQTELTLKCELETGTDYTGKGYLQNLNPTGGTDAAHVTFTASFIGSGELS